MDDELNKYYKREGARTPKRFKERVQAGFRSRENINNLRKFFITNVPKGKLLTFLLDTLNNSVINFDVYSETSFDREALRGQSRPAVSVRSEVERLNNKFIAQRMSFIRDFADTIDPIYPRDGIVDDNESYGMRMFISDSLRPPGLEQLNGPGPLYELREDQAESTVWRGPPNDMLPNGTTCRKNNCYIRGQPRRLDQVYTKQCNWKDTNESFVPQRTNSCMSWKDMAVYHKTLVDSPVQQENFTTRQLIMLEGFPPEQLTKKDVGTDGILRWNKQKIPDRIITGSTFRYNEQVNCGKEKMITAPSVGKYVAANGKHLLVGDVDRYHLNEYDEARSRAGDVLFNQSESIPGLDIYDWQTSGDPSRGPEQAMAEYWGENHVETDSIVGNTELARKSYGEIYSWGNDWRNNSNSRSFMRYPRIPFWQDLVKWEGVDKDIDEDIGTQMRETDTLVRGWNMNRLLNPRGQEYRRYGARNIY